MMLSDRIGLLMVVTLTVTLALKEYTAVVAVVLQLPAEAIYVTHSKKLYDSLFGCVNDSGLETLAYAFNDVTFISGVAGDDGGVVGQRAPKPVATDRNCVSTFVSVTPLNTPALGGTSMFVVTKSKYFRQEVGTSSFPNPREC